MRSFTITYSKNKARDRKAERLGLESRVNRLESTFTTDICEELNQSNAWDAWQWRISMWLGIYDGAITLGVSLHEDITKLISVRSRTLQLEHRLLNHL